MFVSGFAHCKLGVESASVNELEGTADMQELLNAVVKDLEELAIVDPCVGGFDDE